MTSNIIFNELYDKNILKIEFNNSTKKNALSLEMLTEMASKLSQYNYIKKFKCVVITGTKKSAFSSGADLDDIRKLIASQKINFYHKKMNNLLKIITKLEIPVISVIRSHCYGAGFIIAMHSDIIIAAESSSFCIPASKLNIQIPKKQILHLLTKINKSFLGSEYDQPFGFAPMGMCNLTWPGADVMLAQESVNNNVPICVSMASSTSLEKMYDDDFVWLNHSITPSSIANSDFRTTVGIGKNSYHMSVLNISGTSFGAISPPAITSLNKAAKLGKFAHNTGEGSMSKYHEKGGGDTIWQISSGYFGCRKKNGDFCPQNFSIP